ncbi:hypothetical protein WISP_36441 [Willisornis vidua]|uniref:folate gamma-glutamyl hydrolase n=1 Tax=Willisornis vidua TaxID=1566151 RepID=A0ABQ9DIJ7_9PASS|nr:hypothetical protein WISP_36441 [Willisornis vidua]
MGRLAGLRPVPSASLLLLLLLRCAFAFVLRERLGERNDRPIIGILAQECHFDEFQSFGRSYIAASYVKFVESAGARAVPIRLNLTDEEYHRLFHSINGVLFPGGGVDLKTSEYARVAKIFYHKALENFTNNERLRNFYSVLTTNTDDEVEFISTMEAYKYPIYSMQWHPEKNPFEWKNSSGIPHSPSAVKAAYYMADFFVNEDSMDKALIVIVFLFPPVIVTNQEATVQPVSTCCGHASKAGSG